MISITAEEKQAISGKYPNVHIARTMKQDSKRHHYYMEEAPEAVRYLRALRAHSDQGGSRRQPG